MSGRRFASFGALACGLAVGLAAIAMHAQSGPDRLRLAVAAALAFGHGLVLVAIAARDSRLTALARKFIATGTVLFCGSLVGAAWHAWPATFAPVGGIALILGWAILAVDFLRRA